MSHFLVRRLLLTIPVLLGVATLVFSLIHLVPGDPVQAMLGESASPQDMQELRGRLGLDRPLLVQYGSFLRGLAAGNLGLSLRTNQPVATAIAERLPATIELALAAMALALVVAIPLGIIAAAQAGTRVDHLATALALVGISIPNFWLGPLLAIVFSVTLGWLPVSGRGSWAHLVLPSLTLGAPLAAVLARMTRASVLEELRELYVLAARARWPPVRTSAARTNRASKPRRASSSRQLSSPRPPVSIAGGANGGGKAVGGTTPRLGLRTARAASTFCSSRTLPGQS